jgi:hypothetical protein
MENNCWEHMECGREPGGKNQDSLGVCPVTKYHLADGFFCGRDGGGGCAFIVGSFSPGEFEDQCGANRDCKKCRYYLHMTSKYKSSYNVKIFRQYVQNSIDRVNIL